MGAWAPAACPRHSSEELALETGRRYAPQHYPRHPSRRILANRTRFAGGGALLVRRATSSSTGSRGSGRNGLFGERCTSHVGATGLCKHKHWSEYDYWQLNKGLASRSQALQKSLEGAEQLLTQTCDGRGPRARTDSREPNAPQWCAIM